MHIQCTKKMLDHLKVKPAAKTKEDPLFSWHANLVYINRRKTLVLMNDQTQYVIVLHGMVAKDFSKINQWIVEAIQELFHSEGISEEVVDQYLNDAGEVTFHTTKDRANVARLNKAVFNTEVMAGELLDSERKINTQLSLVASRTLVGRGKAGFFKPNEKLYADLQQWAGKKIFDTKAVEMKVTLMLEGHEVWRSLIVPLNRTFEQFHKILQIVFHWMDYHLHEFYIFDQTTTGRDTNYNDAAYTKEGYQPIVNLVCNQEAFSYPMGIEMRHEQGIALSEYIPASKLLVYQYDLGDDWRHRIDVTRVIDHYDGSHPVCLDGVGNAPPEDVGGEGGYDAFLEAINHSDHPDHEHMKQWVRSQGYIDFDLKWINHRLKSK